FAVPLAIGVAVFLTEMCPGFLRAPLAFLTEHDRRRFMEMYHVSAEQIAAEPLDVGPDSKLHLVDVIDRTQGAPFSAGVCEVFPGAPVDFDYDDDAAVCYMLEGDITLSENGDSRSFKPGDVVYIPQKKGLLVYWSTTSYGRFFYVTYPHWR
ncbi:MAG: cupin domain-containing protein, partial [Thermoleophilia bacterium]